MKIIQCMMNEKIQLSGKKRNTNLLLKCYLFFVLFTLMGSNIQAQLNGHNSLGDFGFLSATVPDPGFYATAFYNNYSADKIKNSNGDRITLSPDDPADLTVNAFAGLFWWVSDHKILGANYSTMAVIPFANIALEVPIAGFELETGVAIGDVYIQPINLGWHMDIADYNVGIGLYVPTGRYDVDADDNTGLGMWSFELFAGGTFYFDKMKSWHFATTAFYETHTGKKDSEACVGDLLTLEGGFGKSYFEGVLNFGVAYYAQWKISEDDFGLNFQLPESLLINKHRVFAAGPELKAAVVIKNKIIAIINARYLWEFGARTITEGNTLTVTATFPIPSISVE